MFSKILIANRGEIACRVIETCRRLGIATVAVYSDADRHARHVRMADQASHIGGSRPVESYLRGEVIIEVAKASGAEAIHPGYGFLSENAHFARACAAAGIVFIGPTPEAIEAMGSKSAAKALMEEAGVPVVPGYHGANQEAAYLAEQAEKIGYPLLVKAVTGGGGRGMRLINSAAEFSAQLEAARREAKSAFGGDAVLLERFVQGPHHIEFQVFGDSHGNMVHLYERECSIQRRHQKILEETPSPFLDDALRASMGEAAVAAARAIDYRGAGTVEFIVGESIAGEDRRFFFMEMNTRLQVEHPVTEMITGLDLVEWQLRVAMGEALPLRQADIPRHGRAIEVRLCAEDPDNLFLPEAGPLARFILPAITDQVRVDSGVREGDHIGVFYDSMIAKLIVHGADRPGAIARLQQALAKTAVIGLKTNLAFLQTLSWHPAFIRGETDTQFIERHRDAMFAKSDAAPLAALIAVACRYLHDEEIAQAERAAAAPDRTSPWASNSGWRLNEKDRRSLMFSDPLAGKTTEITLSGGHGRYLLHHDQRTIEVDSTWSGNNLRLEYEGQQSTLVVVRYGSHFSVLMPDTRYELIAVDPFPFETMEEVAGGRLTALMPGRIVKIMVAPGDTVTRGQPLLIMEAMKMEHTIHSPRDGRIERVVHQVDQIVEADAMLFVFAEEE